MAISMQAGGKAASQFDPLPALIQIGVVGLILGLWWWVTEAGIINTFMLPPPRAVFPMLIKVLASGTFWAPLLTTAGEVAAAFIVASVLGCTIGYMVSRSGFMIDVMQPIFAGLFTIPAILFYPLYVFLLGLGPESKIAIGATIAFFPIVLSTISGLSYVDRKYVMAARSMGASPFRMFFSVMLPAAAPALVNGLRIGCTLAYLVILGGEALASREGLGHRIVTYAESMQMTEMFAFIFIVLVISFLFTALLSSFERAVMRHLKL